MELFAVASQRAQWLSARLGVIAGNIANAGTPGYRARDVAPFSAVMENRAVKLARTSPAHLNMSGEAAPARPETREAPAGRMTYSGNSVSLDKELMKGAEVVRSYRLTTSVVRSFHRMYLLALKDN